MRRNETSRLGCGTTGVLVESNDKLVRRGVEKNRYYPEGESETRRRVLQAQVMRLENSRDPSSSMKSPTGDGRCMIVKSNHLKLLRPSTFICTHPNSKPLFLLRSSKYRSSHLTPFPFKETQISNNKRQKTKEEKDEGGREEEGGKKKTLRSLLSLSKPKSGREKKNQIKILRKTSPFLGKMANSGGVSNFLSLLFYFFIFFICHIIYLSHNSVKFNSQVMLRD